MVDGKSILEIDTKHLGSRTGQRADNVNDGDRPSAGTRHGGSGEARLRVWGGGGLLWPTLDPGTEEGLV